MVRNSLRGRALRDGFDSWPKLKAYVVTSPDAEPWATPRAWAEKMGHSDVWALL